MGVSRINQSIGCFCKSGLFFLTRLWIPLRPSALKRLAIPRIKLKIWNWKTFCSIFYKTQNENCETDIILKYENSFSILGLHTRFKNPVQICCEIYFLLCYLYMVCKWINLISSVVRAVLITLAKQINFNKLLQQ